MDHLPLPRSPVALPLEIPYVCHEEYDGQLFMDYPRRMNATASDQEDIAFIQNWLFFGLLNEFFGKSSTATATRLPFLSRMRSLFRSKIDLKRDFTRRNDHGSPILTTAKLGNYSRNWLCRIQNLPKQARAELFLHIRECLVEANLRASLADMRPQYDWRVVFSIYVLMDYLRSLIIFANKEHVVIFPEMVLNGKDGFVTKRLVGLGWCPYEANRLSVKSDPSAIYYVSNLEPPRKSKSHSECSEYLCKSETVDEKNYTTKHRKSCKDCPFLFVGEDALRCVLEKGSIPLVTLETGGGGAPNLKVIEWTPGMSYVAISHVWSDGLGNVHANALPTCQLIYLRGVVSKAIKSNTLSTPFWIDTVCCPRFPKESRNLAISAMRETYERASAVLVLDSYLQVQDSRSLGPLELIMRAACAPWQRRLWTFQEGALARQLLLQFEDIAVDFDQTFWQDVWNGEKYENPLPQTLASTVFEIRGRRGISEQRADRTLEELSNALAFRTTSITGDEAVCLATILNLDISKILSIPRKDTAGRMKAFWQSMTTIPVSSISSPGPKLQERGYRWAPATFLGGQRAKLPLGDPNNTRYASLTPSGLEFSCDGFILTVPQLHRAPNNEGGFLFKDNADNWYSVVMMQPVPLNNSWWSLAKSCRIALISIAPIHRPKLFGRIETNFESQNGILASISEPEANQRSTPVELIGRVIVTLQSTAAVRDIFMVEESCPGNVSTGELANMIRGWEPSPFVDKDHMMRFSYYASLFYNITGDKVGDHLWCLT